MVTCTSPELIAACHVLHHNPNQAIHLVAYINIQRFKKNLWPCNTKAMKIKNFQAFVSYETSSVAVDQLFLHKTQQLSLVSF
jgi:hypothetical protein